MCLSTSAAVSVAHAFTDPAKYIAPATEGGSEGRWFTGSPADGYGCGVCHAPNKGEKLVVEGLPAGGYVPDTDYYIRIAWPVTANHTRTLYDAPPPAPLPRAGLVAEMIAETSEDSGMIHGGWPDPGSDFSQGSLSRSAMGELCHVGPTSPRKRFGYSLYRQPQNGVAKPVSVCQGTNLTRCLIAARGCGSEELRFTWRSPKLYQGAIWFSASFVATDQANVSPDGDAVSEVTIPIAPAGARGYESELKQSCSLISLPSATHRLPLCSLAPGFVLGLFVWRRRRSRRRGGRA